MWHEFEMKWRRKQNSKITNIDKITNIEADFCTKYIDIFVTSTILVLVL